MSRTNKLTLFESERKRDLLAQEKKLTAFRKTYEVSAKAIKDFNSRLFWNKKILEKVMELNNSPIYLDKINQVFKFLKNTNGNFLDVGFGYGDLEKKLVSVKNIKIHGVDISTFAIQKAEKNLVGEYRVGSVLEIPYKDKFFNVVVALDVLEHIPFSKTFRALSEVKRVLISRGIFIISVPLNEGLEELVNSGKNPNGHLRVYTPEILRAELKLAGFEVMEETYLYAFSKSYVLKSFLLRRFPNLRKPNLMILFAYKK